MARRAGRGPRDQNNERKLSPAAAVFEALVPLDRTKVECLLCHEWVRSIEDHLVSDHPRVAKIDYITEFPGAALKGEDPDPADDVKPTRVTPKEAAQHPGGRHGAELERDITDPTEKRIYREEIQALIEAGHEAGYLVAAVAYRMLLARRLRVEIEQARSKTNGAIYSGENMTALDKLEKRVSDDLKVLEELRQARAPDDENPLKVIESELEQAEAFIRANIGDFEHECPSCRQILTPPALPHWAFQPIDTDRGREWSVWSPELWRLVFERQIPLWQMAFALRTSPEGLRVTANRRNETWPDWIVLETEERELRKVLDELDRERSTPFTPVEAVESS